MSIDMRSFSIESTDGIFTGQISLEVKSKDQLEETIKHLRRIEGVTSVKKNLIFNLIKNKYFMEQPKIHLTPADKYIVRPVNKFISKSTTGGIVLFIAALIAIFFANSEWSEEYNHFGISI